MADIEEVSESESQLLSEYKDGQLQIVEVRPFEKDVLLDGEVVSSLSELETDGETKYVQLVNAGDKSMMQLDLLNLTLVKFDDGTESYRLVANDAVAGDGESDSTVTCVLASSDNEGNEDSEGQEAYMVMQGEQGPIMFLQSSLTESQQPETELNTQPVTKKVEIPAPAKEKSTATTNRPLILSPAEILEKAKALQKAKALLKVPPPRQRARKRKTDLPPPHELLSSPGFKLFLYSCKACPFKCNATKEMRAHRMKEHSGNNAVGGSSRFRGREKITLQCAKCPYKGHTHMQLMKHVQDLHHYSSEETNSNKVYLNTDEVKAADVLVCGACGFESPSRFMFRKHIEKEHGATAVTL